MGEFISSNWQDALWITIGFLGQGLFTARMLVQWVASERRRDSVIPVAFWWLSLLGGFTLLAYALRQRDPVFFTGQSTGVIIYVRNLMIIHRKNKVDDQVIPAPMIRRRRPEPVQR
jgi:lipid-A-disaccharide synthase-like uncharacterized protein